MDRSAFNVSPALIVAVIALVVAATGTALAGPAALERALTKSEVKAIAGKAAKKAVAARAPVFAQIDQDGIVDAANSGE